MDMSEIDKKLEYKVVNGVGLLEIESNVNKEINQGWTPIGGVSVSVILENTNVGAFQKTMYSQALIKNME